MSAQPPITGSIEDPVLIDGCGRPIDHLRLSVTWACDLHCIYCRPHKFKAWAFNRRSLSDKQRLEFVRFLHDRYGLFHVRITGGEPLLYHDLASFIASVRRALPDVSMAMTTNAQRLAQQASELRQAGLDRLNVSLDSLDPDRYRRMTGGSLEKLLAGLASAESAGFPPPKLNTVVLKGINDDEIIELVSWAAARRSEIRFLEAMPIGPTGPANRCGLVSAGDIRRKLAEHFELTLLSRAPGETAQRYRAVGKTGSGVVGLIASISEPFCGGCRRIRLTADGRVFPCLLDSRCVDLSVAWRDGELCTTLADKLIRSAVSGKQLEGPKRQDAAMFMLGG